MEILIYSCCIYKSGNMKKSKMRVFARKFVEEFFPVRMRDKISIFARSSGKLQCENRGLNLTGLNKKKRLAGITRPSTCTVGKRDKASLGNMPKNMHFDLGYYCSVVLPHTTTVFIRVHCQKHQSQTEHNKMISMLLPSYMSMTVVQILV